MTYRAYYRKRGAGQASPLEKHRAPFMEFFDVDAALQWAGQIAKRELIVFTIDGDDGTHLTKHEIAAALAGRPRA
jgi:hypothetical protein